MSESPEKEITTDPGLGRPRPRCLLLLPDRNVHEHDWSGAFLVESARCASLWQVPKAQVVQIDVSRPPPQRLEQLLQVLERQADLDFVALFCHGWHGGVQLGPHIPDAQKVAAALAPRARPDLAVALYACSTGEGTDDSAAAPGGEGGFADALRDALVGAGLTGAHVDGHTVIGHCTRNPYVRRFSKATATGGEWIVAPDDPLFSSWRKKLKDTDLRLRFPLLSLQTIRDEVAG